MNKMDYIKMDRKALRALAEASTKVVGWYPHSQYDGYHPGQASVRGPFGRWLMVQGGDNGMKDPIKYPVPVADLYDDAKFAAAAMNNLLPLLDEIDRLEKEVAELRSEQTERAALDNLANFGIHRPLQPGSGCFDMWGQEVMSDDDFREYVKEKNGKRSL